MEGGLVAGVDEAGKGPAIGPMFAAAVVAPAAEIPDDVADSKQLAPSRRQSLAGTLRNHPKVRIGVASVPPGRIDAPDSDMNGLTVAVQASALRSALDDVEPTAVECTLDAGDVDAERFGRRVRDRLPEGVQVRAEHGADEASPAVGAASIIAKVERDASIAALANCYGTEIGSGYPSDSATRAFLDTYITNNGRLPGGARRSWATCQELLARAEQTGLDAFED